MGACLEKWRNVGSPRSRDQESVEGNSVYYTKLGGGGETRHASHRVLCLEDFHEALSGVVRANYLSFEIPQQNNRNEQHKFIKVLSITKFYDLPLEILDIILQKSYLHWILNSSTKQKDEIVIRSLLSVDVCFYRKISRQRFRKTIWRHLEEFYERTKKISALIRNNRNYLMKSMQPTDEFIQSLFNLNCITEEQRHFIHRQSSMRDKNYELLHVIRNYGEKKFSSFLKCLRQTSQTTVSRIIKNGGVVIKVEVENYDTNNAAPLDPQLLQRRFSDLQSIKTKSRSNKTDALTRQLREEDVKFLNFQLDRETAIVWIWCRSKAALEFIQKLHESNQLRNVFYGVSDVRPSTSEITRSVVINIDQNQFKKTVVEVGQVSVNFSERITTGNETVSGVTKLRNRIFILSLPSPPYVYVFEDCNPFRCKMGIEMGMGADPKDIGCSKKENCLYVSDQRGKCVWKITRPSECEHKTIKWLTIDYAPHTLSVSSNGHLLLVTSWSSSLNIYGSDAGLIRSIQLPGSIDDPVHAVETSIGNFFILHQWMKNEEQESEPGCDLSEWMWVVSELTRDGQMVTRRFIPSNETQKLQNPRYLSLDSDDQVFVVDTRNDRVILLDSDLNWNRILCPSTDQHEVEKSPRYISLDSEYRAYLVDTGNDRVILFDNELFQSLSLCPTEEEHENEGNPKFRMPLRMCYDEGKKQLIVVGGYFYSGFVNIYTFNKNSKSLFI